MNRWFGIGNLTNDPEVRYTPQGTTVASFSIAINSRDRDGKEREPLYVDIVAWDRLAETVAEYCRKGHKVAVEGALQVNKWQDDEGNTRRRWLIRAYGVEFLTPRTDDGGQRPAKRQKADDLEDLPF